MLSSWFHQRLVTRIPGYEYDILHALGVGLLHGREAADLFSIGKGRKPYEIVRVTLRYNPNIVITINLYWEGDSQM